jgi:hypothetical protein
VAFEIRAEGDVWGVTERRVVRRRARAVQKRRGITKLLYVYRVGSLDFHEVNMGLKPVKEYNGGENVS